MFKIDNSAGQVIANDTQKSVDAINNAVMFSAHLCASVVEVSKASNLPIHAAQKALANAAEGLASLVAGRENVSNAVREMVAIQKRSSLTEVSFGCPELPATGQLTEVAATQQNA